MLEVILDKQVLFILMGIFTALGVLSKCIVNIALKRLVKAAGNMGKSTHPLMRLVRAKFEHACMVSDKVQNVGVFVEKYMYEYKTVGVKLHSWRRLEKGACWMCLILGAVAAGLQYYLYGMNDQVLWNGAVGAILAILLFLFHLTTDETYQFGAAKNYMVDYLENVCAHRYSKGISKDMQEMAPPEMPMPEAKEMGVKEAEKKTADKKTVEAKGTEAKATETKAAEVKATETKVPEIEQPERPHPREEVPSPTHDPEIKPPVMPKPEPVPKEVRIREILEEFLA